MKWQQNFMTKPRRDEKQIQKYKIHFWLILYCILTPKNKKQNPFQPKRWERNSFKNNNKKT